MNNKIFSIKGIVFLFFAISLFVGTYKLSYVYAGDPLPSIPGGLAAVAVPPSRINVSWGASTGGTGGIQGYYLYRDGTLLTFINTTSFADSGLSAGFHNYSVEALDGAGVRSFRTFPVNATLVFDNTPPTSPGNVIAAGNPSSTKSTTQVKISWGASSDDTAVTGYNVYRDNVFLTSSTALTATSYTDGGISPGTYLYSVEAYDAARNISNRSFAKSVTIVFDATPPSQPTNLVVKVSARQTFLSWKASSDEVGVVGYYVYRNGASLTSVASTTFTNSDLATTTYSYAVAAYDTAGNISARSSVADATIVWDTTTPTPPSNIFVTAVDSSTAKVSWNPSFDEVGVAGYYVYKNEKNIGSASSTSYIDSGLAAGTYTYTVAAYDAAGNVSVQPAATSVTAPFAIKIIQNPIATSSATIASTTATTTKPSSVSGTLTITLRLGLRSDQVRLLQSILAQQNYISSESATGFFGSLTEKAVKKLQCDKSIVCKGSPTTTGWGMVGAKTRNILNELNHTSHL